MRYLAALLLAVSVASCGSDGPSTPDRPSPVGSWTLSTIGGVPLPYILEQLGDDKLELVEAAFTTTNTGTFSAVSKQRMTISGQATDQSFNEDGSYTMNGETVKLTFNTDNSSVNGTLRGDSITFADSGIPVVYRRR
ncbi:MAG TPA: hypothetical protein VIP11_24235 [Gemmatimonadaceae bacterium]